MIKLKSVLLIWLMAVTGGAHAMEGVFDRSAEVDRYIDRIRSGNPETLVGVAKEIIVSGISDPRLATVVSERLLADHQHIADNRSCVNYAAWMAKALASFGDADYAATLKTVSAETRFSKLRAACDAALLTIGWNHARNAIMASRQYYQEGDNPEVSRLMNLLMADDYSYKWYAADRMNWGRVLDKRLMAAIAPQVQLYLDRGTGRLIDRQDDTIAKFVRLLGYSNNPQYRPLLESVLVSSAASAVVKKHAKGSLKQLQPAL